MGKKPQVMNKKMIAIGGGAIIVLGLLLVGTYGNSLKTMVSRGGDDIFGGRSDRGPNSAACVAATNVFNNELAIAHSVCTPNIIVTPSTPSQQCLAAMNDLALAARAMGDDCDGSEAPTPPSWEEYEESFKWPPGRLAPPGPMDDFASTTPQPTIIPPAAARPGV